jgi:hypothetical protein
MVLKVKHREKSLILSNDSSGGHQQTARILAQTLCQHGWQPQIISTYREIFPLLLNCSIAADDFNHS